MRRLGTRFITPKEYCHGTHGINRPNLPVYYRFQKLNLKKVTLNAIKSCADLSCYTRA